MIKKSFTIRFTTQTATLERCSMHSNAGALERGNDLPLRDGDDALKVNWCELTITNGKGDKTYKSSWITNHLISKENVIEIVKAARARWKIENENNNVLKTKGYHLEHNFGHGNEVSEAKRIFVIYISYFEFTSFFTSYAYGYDGF